MVSRRVKEYKLRGFIHFYPPAGQQPTTTKDGEKGKAYLMLVISEEKVLSSLIAVRGAQISAISLLNRAQQRLHSTWEEISISIISVHSFFTTLFSTPELGIRWIVLLMFANYWSPIGSIDPCISHLLQSEWDSTGWCIEWRLKDAIKQLAS